MFHLVWKLKSNVGALQTAEDKKRYKMKGSLIVCFLLCLTSAKSQSYCKDTIVHYNFSARHVKYPQTAVEAGIQGQVVIGFEVDSTCAITNRKVITGIGYGCDEVALKSMDELEEKLKTENKSKCCRFKGAMTCKFKMK